MNTQQIAALAKADSAVINLAVGELDFPTPPPTLEAAERALSEEETRRYAPIYGFRELRELAALDFQRDGLSATSENVLIGPGAKPLLAAALSSIARPGDTVLIPKPYYPPYLTACRALGLKTKIISGLPTANDLKNGQVLILNYPNNPTGEIWDLKGIDLPKNFWVIADEAYREIIFDRQHQWTSIGAGHKKTITIRSLSKGHNMAGWRVGYLTTPYKSVIKRVVEYLGAVVGCACSVSQKAAIAALKNGATLSSEQIDDLRLRKDLIVNFFRESERGVPTTDPAGGLYLWVDISQFGLSSCEMTMFLLKTAKVAVSPGRDYGDDSCVRICFSAVPTAQIKDALKKIESALGGV